MDSGDFQIQQIKQHAVIDSQLENIFTWRKEMALPSFEKMEKRIERTNDELKLIDDKTTKIDNKIMIVIALNIMLLVVVIGKAAPDLLKALVAVL